MTMIENIDVNGEKLTYWRSIERRKRTKEYLSSIENEFVADLTDITSMDRRSMLKVMGASIALAGIGVSCRRPVEKILPYVKQPEDMIPGIPNYYATAQPTPFGANGLLVESHEGRPTKVEGNPSHPESAGKASLINQASVLELYDPDRSRFCQKYEGSARIPAEWADFDKFVKAHFFALKSSSGKGLAFVADSDLSPTFLRVKSEIKARFPQSKFYVHEPMRQHNVEAAAAMTFGANSRVRYHFENAKVIASIFADPFSFGPEHMRHMRGYGKNRTVLDPKDAKNMSRVFAVEADYSLAGTNADHRTRLPVGLAVNFVRALAYELHATFHLDIEPSIPKSKTLSTIFSKPPSYKGLNRQFILVLAKDLALNKGKALVVGGDHLPPAVLSMIHVLNTVLKGAGQTFDVVTVDNADAVAHLKEPGIKQLADDLKSDQVNTLVFLGVNPAYDAPRNLDFTSLIAKAKTSIHLGQTLDETGMACTWHVPQTHYLEHFADTRAYDGHISLIQPLIRPLHDARSTLQVLAQMADLELKTPLELVKDTFKRSFGGADADLSFDRALHEGVIAGTAFKAGSFSVDSQAIYTEFDKVTSRAPNKDNFELVLTFDRRVLDGRYANLGWLEELPDPVTKLNWGNALLISPVAARELGLKSGVKKNAYVADMIEVTVNNQTVVAPSFVVPGLADHSVVLSLGYGRKKAGAIGNDVGVDAYGFVADYASLVHHGVKLKRTGATTKLSSTQEQFAMNGDTVQEIDTLTLQNRDPARVTTVADYLKSPSAAKNVGMPDSLLRDEPGKKEKVPLQVTDAWDYTKGNQWGMVIDLAKCTGCNACVVACQSENNIPVVGKEQVIRGRSMHWLRVDRYFVGDVKSPLAISQPVPCMHCENAPCEPVCPVAATSHDKEGLNAMTYNRCVGTRYCANNCPYKVRRFNYFDFTHTGNMHVDDVNVERQKTIKLQRNPDVTVRYRGVMEKCTYCTQRIQEAKMLARREGKDHNALADGTVTPACAQTCPSEAIVFGNINDASSRVSKLKGYDRNYTLLDVLNARPRTSYLPMLRNPNPDLVA